MNARLNIAIIAGGYSSEYVVSLKSADGVYSFLDPEKYTFYKVIIVRDRWYALLPDGMEIDIDKNDFSFVLDGQTVRFDFAYITIHGTPGEDGTLQGYFDMLEIPYSCCGVLAAALTFNKYFCNQYLKGRGIRVADSIRLTEGECISNVEVIKTLGLPVFIKPNDGGSSCGTTKVKTAEEIQPSIERAFAEGREVLIESFMPGTEVTCGCYKINGKTVVFPLTEVVSKNEFFDFEAKYTASKVDEITPARIPDELALKIQTLTTKIYDYVGAKGIIRVDFIIDPDQSFRMLEVNTTPGMTTTSFIPQQVRAAGLDIRTVLSEIIDNEINKQ